MDIDDWTDADRREAHREGWDIFEAFDTENGPYQLQKIDDRAPAAGRFPVLATWDSDDDLWAYVWESALLGDQPHAKALSILRDISPAEYSAIRAARSGLGRDHDQ